MQRGDGVGEDLLRQILRSVVVAGAAAEVAVHLPVVAAERLLGDLVHTILLGHR